MDKWEEMMQKMQQMTSDGRMKLMEKINSMCICRNCPSYMGTGETDVQFCGMGKSSRITEEKGCICGGCNVMEYMGLTKLYYCTRGNEAQQRGVPM